MTAAGEYGWARKALPWICLLLVELGAARGLQASAETMPLPIYTVSTSSTTPGACADMGRRVDMNVLVAMDSEQLEYLEASLCSSDTSVGLQSEGVILDGRMVANIEP
jgi:hypothetical protein